jgi:cellulose synthase operon protein C
MQARTAHAWLGGFALALALTPARAADPPPVPLPGESRGTASRLAEARKLLAAKKWDDAVAVLQSVLDSAGNDLVPLSPRRSLCARRLCHVLLAGLPPDALRRYRNRVEPRARKALQRGLADSDPDLLARVVDDSFCSRSAEKALDALGNLAFERGRFDEAEAWWRLLAPPRPVTRKQAEEEGLLAYPDPEADVPRVRAKQLLARLFRGPDPDWDDDLKAFRKQHPTAAGNFAGRKGRYADLLASEASELKKERRAPDPDWPTFAGSPARGRIAPAPPRFLEHLARLGRAGPTWTVDLQNHDLLEGAPDEDVRDIPAAQKARSLAFYPVIAGNHLLVCDARYITALDLRTGRVEVWYDLKDSVGGVNPNLKLPAPPDLRYTLTVADGCVFARLGAQEVKDVRPPERAPGGLPRAADKDTESVIVCLSLAPGRGPDRRRWLVRAIDLGRKEYAVFEGSPAVARGRVYVAATRFAGDRALTAIHCYPADPEDTEPPLLWRSEVCESRDLPRPADGDDPPAPSYRVRHHLLTLAGSQVVYCSHSGSVVACDARTGKRTWAVRYPRRDTHDAEDDPHLRDLAPCLFAGGRLYVAPADSDRLLCLDPATGVTLWEREGMDVVHLLGVGQGRLIFTTRRNASPGRLPSAGLRAVGAADGSDSRGWSLPDDGGSLTPMGRGLLVGDLVLWPTDRSPYGVFAVRQRDGLQPDDPSLLHRIPSGNLVYARGCLAVAGRRTLEVFVPPGMLLEEKEHAARRDPDSPRASLDLARAKADSGLLDASLSELARAERLAAKGAGHTARTLLRAAHAERAEVVREKVRRAGRARELEQALRETADLPPGARLRALAESARRWQELAEPTRAVVSWQGILSSPALRDLQVQEGAGTPRRAGETARQEIDTLLAARGAGVYEAFEKKARTLWDGASEKDRAAVAGRLADEFPNARVTRKALLERARARAAANSPGAAAADFRRLLTLGVTGDEQVASLAGLARAYERQRCWPAARSAWRRLARDHPDARVPALDPDRPARAAVAAHLRRPEFSERPPPEPSLPLLRSWQLDLAPGERALPDPESRFLWTARAVPAGQGELLRRSAEDGAVAWRCGLPFVPAWAATYDDRVLVGGPAGVACLRAEDGVRSWLFPAPARAHEPLSDFRLAGGRVFCLQGLRRLFALDADTGSVLWARWAPGAPFRLPAPRGRFNPAYHAGADIVLAQAANHLWALDAPTGRLRHNSRTPASPWPRPPLALDEHTFCLVPDADTVLLFRTDTGRARWTHTPPGETTRSGEPPLVVGGPDALLVAVPLNVGLRLQRLDPATGRPLWKNPPLLPPGRLDPGAWAFDPETFYHADSGVLTARSLADGTVRWQSALAGEGDGWGVKRTPSAVVAYPARVAGARFQFRWLFGSVQYRGRPPRGGAMWAASWLAPKDGRLVQRLNLCPGLPRWGAEVDGPRGAGVFPTLGLLPTGEPALEVFRAGGRLVFAGDRRVWGYGSEPGPRRPGL